MELQKLPIKIVYYEGNDAVHPMTTSYLSEHVDAVFTAKNATEALQIVNQKNPNVVVVNLDTTQTQGIRFIQSIKNKNPDIPIIVTTDFDKTHHLTKAIQTGVTRYIHKDSQPQKLLDIIRNHFKFTENGFLSITIDQEGQIDHISEVFAHYLGYEPQELLGQPLKRIIKSMDEEAFDTVQLSQYPPSSRHIQAVFLKKNGKQKVMGGSFDTQTRASGDDTIYTFWYPIDCLLRSYEEVNLQLQKENYLKSLLQLYAFINKEAISSTDAKTFFQKILNKLPSIEEHLTGCLLRKSERLYLDTSTQTTRLNPHTLFPQPVDLDDEELEKIYLPCFLAIRHKQIVFIDDISFLAPSPFKETLQVQGVATLVTIPIFPMEGKGFYLLTLLYSHSHTFDKEELDLWKNIADAISSGLATIKIHTERDALIRKLDKIAHTDRLTGLINRYRGMEILQYETNRSDRYKTPLCLIFFDIDNFKKINDTFGHETGDKILRSVTQTIRNSLRKTDTLIRWGGEEFVIVLPQTSLKETLSLIQKIREKMQKRNDNTLLPVTASFGVAEWKKGQKLEKLIAHADAKMYEAKRLGRNRVAY